MIEAYSIKESLQLGLIVSINLEHHEIIGMSKLPIILDRVPDSNLNRVKYVSIGKQFKVECLNPIASPFCSMFNPAGYLVEPTKCEHTITSFAMEHIGIWKCFNGVGNSMDSLVYKVELRGICKY